MDRIKISKILIILLISFGTYINAFEKFRIRENYNLKTENNNTDWTELKIYFEEKLRENNTSNCLSCHDGVTATDANMTLGLREPGIPKGIGHSHPVEINYEQVYLKKMRTFIPPESLDPRIKLDENNITCLTCHDENSSLKNHLVMENHRSRLCLSCHNL